LEQERRCWRGRRTKEWAVLKQRRRQVVEAERQITADRQLLLREKKAWEAQRRRLQAELHGLNNRIVHQREKHHELRAEVLRLERPAPEPAHPPADPAPDNPPRLTELAQLAGELADQRVLLMEQWERLARVQQRWEEQRGRVAADLEALARTLV